MHNLITWGHKLIVHFICGWEGVEMGVRLNVTVSLIEGGGLGQRYQKYNKTCYIVFVILYNFAI